MGYSGGSEPDPTYYHLGDHSETVQIVYDPAKISYCDLLEVYWRNAAASVPSWSRQYMSIIFYHNDEQKRIAEETRAEQEKLSGRTVYVEIIPAMTFYPAEDYHQKYYLQQNSKLMKELRSIYPDFQDFVSSTAVTRLNGYAGGFGDPQSLENLEVLGLSPEGMKIVRDMTRQGIVSACPVKEVPAGSGS